MKPPPSNDIDSQQFQPQIQQPTNQQNRTTTTRLPLLSLNFNHPKGQEKGQLMQCCWHKQAHTEEQSNDTQKHLVGNGESTGDMGVSKNRGTPKWMVYFMENPIKMDDLRGPPLFFGNTHMKTGL